jgi:hypothetical protein
MKQFKTYFFAITCVFILALMPICNSTKTTNEIIKKIDKNRNSSDFEELFVEFEQDDLANKLFLILKLLRIIVVTFVIFLVFDKLFEKSENKSLVLLELIIDLLLGFLLTFRVNNIIRQILA